MVGTNTPETTRLWLTHTDEDGASSWASFQPRVLDSTICSVNFSRGYENFEVLEAVTINRLSRI